MIRIDQFDEVIVKIDVISCFKTLFKEKQSDC